MGVYILERFFLRPHHTCLSVWLGAHFLDTYVKVNRTLAGWDSGDWNDILLNISPYGWAYLGVAFALAFSVIGAAWGIWVTGSTLIGASVKSPRISTKNLISIIFCEATAIYGIIISVILNGKIHGQGTLVDADSCAKAFFAGYCVFWSGLSVGLTNIASGWCVGVSGSSCASQMQPTLLSLSRFSSLKFSAPHSESLASSWASFNRPPGTFLSNKIMANWLHRQ